MKKILFALLIMIIFIYITPAYAAEFPSIFGKAGILIDFESGQILYQKNPHEKLYPASTTKMLTGLIILENHSLDEIVTIDSESPFVEGSKIFIEEGEHISVKDLLYATLIDSSNDCAAALAVFHSGSIQNFAVLMNQRAKELGANNSNFVNPHGLHNDEHYTTAFDLALIAREAYKNDLFREIVSLATYHMSITNKHDEPRYYKTSNKFLFDTNIIYYGNKYVTIKYDIVDGIKSGYTTNSKNVLVATAKKNDIRLISVVMRSDIDNIYLDSRKLLDYGFDNYKYHYFTFSGNKITSIPIENGTVSSLNLFASSTVKNLIPITYDIGKIEEKIILNQVILPIHADDVLGKIDYYIEDTLIGSTNLISDKEVIEKNLLLSLTNFLIKKNNLGVIDTKYYLNILLNIFISFLIWRTIITIFRLRKRKKYANKKNVSK